MPASAEPQGPPTVHVSPSSRDGPASGANIDSSEVFSKQSVAAQIAEPVDKATNKANGGANGTIEDGDVFNGASNGDDPQTSNRATPVSPVFQSRRSVQFARSNTGDSGSAQLHSRQGSVPRATETLTDSPGKDTRASSLFLKIKNLASSSGPSSHTRSHSGLSLGGSSTAGEDTPHTAFSPASERSNRPPHDTLHEESSDADAEESGGEAAEGPNRRRRKNLRRRANDGVQTEPTTPKAPIRSMTHHANNASEGNTPTSEMIRPFRPRRRATMTDLSDQERDRAGVSEGEGRDRLNENRSSPWRRGSHWVQYARGQSYSASPRPPNSQHAKQDHKRPNTLRRLTGFGAHDDPGEGSPLPRKKAERASTISAAKWRSLKAGLRMMGQKKKEEKIDNLKSTELLAELSAVTPAALILASMFQRDEHGNRRIPILLEQLKIKITDSQKVDLKSSSERHQTFRIELEYGSGLTRMKWVIHRTIRDFVNLHLRYKLQQSSEKYKQLSTRSDDPKQKLPHFPNSTFPYLRGIRGLDSDEEDDDDDDLDTAPSGTESGPSAALKKKHKRRPSYGGARRKSSGVLQGSELAQGPTNGEQSTQSLPPGSRRDPYPERQRRKLEQYMQKMIRHLAFRADSNRLCKFLELSALGVRLAAEGSYHGKEGLMVIQSSKGIDQRRGWQPQQLANRHSPKWFLVRHSYIVCVGSPEQMQLYDVFLVDDEFNIQPRSQRKRDAVKDKDAKQFAKSAKETATNQKHHTLKITNSERKLKLLAKNERQLNQFERSLRFMASQTPWAEKNRFGSFAPVRQGVFAQWLVDGRDHMWNVSRAISMARDVIYIHDWWLSPELYMRRPPAISQKWRLDRLLQRKAREGVKVFVIVYRNIDSAIPIDSQYTKFSLLDLHQNVFVQRSPNQARQGAFFWAHHEKLCIVDHTVAFVGGIDLCFGRWDTPQHSVTDDKLTGYEASDTPKDADHCQLWPGKDYSNPRIQDFYSLDKPYEEMYDRTKVARMPWHDISMQIVGQPARDLTRHFVQRWNFILRQRTPSRPTPFLLPPADFNPADLETLGLNGTCEIQILRSCGQWSIGYLTKNRVEHSIMTAYAKMIEESDHFVYMENQFFITSCEVMGTKVENIIGDALVERIVRAFRNGEDWRAVIVIPLLPGFQNTVDEQDGTSVRLIMQCQLYSICRGETSIFARLRALDIEPEDYIQFYSLRSWGRIGPTKTYVTEQLYIHAKCMIVDDRIAIIGSANINERSMLGSRDSECAAVVRDTDMIKSTMGGEPYLVGRFPHTLRKRLMREHLGLDVDQIEEDERAQTSPASSQDWERDMNEFHGDNATIESGTTVEAPSVSKETEEQIAQSRRDAQDRVIDEFDKTSDFGHNETWSAEKTASNASQKPKDATDKPEANGINANLAKVKSLEQSNNDGQSDVTTGFPALPPLPPQFNRATTAQLGLPQLSQLPSLPIADDTDIGGPPVQRSVSKSSSAQDKRFDDIHLPKVERDCMQDPLSDAFYLDIWHTVAENNTKIFRNVFRCMPDNEVKTWKEYQQYTSYSDEFAAAQGAKNKKPAVQRASGSTSGPPGQGMFVEKINHLNMVSDIANEAERKVEVIGGKIIDKVPGLGDKLRPDENASINSKSQPADGTSLQDERKLASRESQQATEAASREGNTETKDFQRTATEKAGPSSEDAANQERVGSQRRRRRGTTRSSRREFNASDGLMSWPDVEHSLNMVQGHLVVWPYDWLEKEDKGGNWLYNIDQLAPLEIYN